MLPKKHWSTNDGRSFVVTWPITETAGTFVSNATSGTRNTDLTDVESPRHCRSHSVAAPAVQSVCAVVSPCETQAKTDLTFADQRIKTTSRLAWIMCSCDSAVQNYHRASVTLCIPATLLTLQQFITNSLNILPVTPTLLSARTHTC